MDVADGASKTPFLSARQVSSRPAFIGPLAAGSAYAPTYVRAIVSKILRSVPGQDQYLWGSRNFVRRATQPFPGS